MSEPTSSVNEDSQPVLTTSAISTVHLPRIAIKFCTQCKWNLRAAYVGIQKSFHLLSRVSPIQPTSYHFSTPSSSSLSFLPSDISPPLKTVRPRTPPNLLPLSGRSIPYPCFRRRVHDIPLSHFLRPHKLNVKVNFPIIRHQSPRDAPLGPQTRRRLPGDERTQVPSAECY
jgi:hypothetical protein